MAGAFEMPIDSKTNATAIGMMGVAEGLTINNGGFAMPEYPTFKKAGAVEFKAEAGNSLVYAGAVVAVIVGFFVVKKLVKK